MASEWEELEKLSKDELIIELVRQRWLYRDLKLLIRRISEEEGEYYGAPGQVPPREWQERSPNTCSLLSRKGSTHTRI